MVKIFLFALSASLVYLFFSATHPLAMGLILLVQTFCLSLLSGLVSQTFWLRYVLFLVLLGGILVLFLYVTRLARNELFTPRVTLSVSASVVFGLVCGGLSWPLFYPLKRSFSWSAFPLSECLSASNFTPASFLTAFYNFPTLGVTLTLAWYLLLALLIVAKIINAKAGPLRSYV